MNDLNNMRLRFQTTTTSACCMDISTADLGTTALCFMHSLSLATSESGSRQDLVLQARSQRTECGQRTQISQLFTANVTFGPKVNTTHKSDFDSAHIRSSNFFSGSPHRYKLPYQSQQHHVAAMFQLNPIRLQKAPTSYCISAK